MKVKIIKNRHIFFSLSLMFSVIIHFGALAHIKGFGLPDSFPQTLFITSIEKEGSHETARANSIGGLIRRDTRTEKKSPIGGEEEQGEGSDSESLSGRDSGITDQENTNVTEEKQDESRGAEEAALGTNPDKEEPQREGGGERPDEPRSVSERLYYEIYWLGIYVGNATVNAAIHGDNVVITSQVHSAPLISNFYQVEDYAESMIVDGLPTSFRIKQHEGKYRSNKETLFDIGNQKIVYFDYLKDLKAEHTLSVPALWDVISGFYHLRTQPLDIGKAVFIDVFDSNKFLSVEVDVLRKEKIILFDKEEVDTIMVKPILKSEGLFQKKGDIFIWLTDDEVRIPVRVETEVPVGKVVAELKSIDSEK